MNQFRANELRALFGIRSALIGNWFWIQARQIGEKKQCDVSQDEVSGSWFVESRPLPRLEDGKLSKGNWKAGGRKEVRLRDFSAVEE